MGVSLTEKIVVGCCVAAYTAVNVYNNGWRGLFVNHMVIGGLVAGWVCCLVFHAKP